MREAVLRSLGWELVRVWSTDWWIDAEGALDRLDAALTAALDRSRVLAAEAAVPAEEATPALLDSLDWEDVGEGNEESEPAVELLGGDYRITDLSATPAIDSARFQEPDYAPVLRDMILQIVAAEAPIRDTLLVERIARAHGFKRSGRLIRERVMTIVRGLAHLEVEPSGASFVWPDALASVAWDRARFPNTSTDIRPIEDIALPELAAAIRGLIGAEDALTEAARRFGVRRVSAPARDRLGAARPVTGHIRD